MHSQQPAASSRCLPKCRSPAVLALAVERGHQLLLDEAGASQVQLGAQPAAQLGAAPQRLPQAPAGQAGWKGGSVSG